MGKEGNDGAKAAEVAEARRRFAEMERGQCARIREAARKDYEEALKLSTNFEPAIKGLNRLDKLQH